MDIRILGPLDVHDGTAPVALGGRKQRALLAMLVLEANRTVSVDRLVDGLWGEDVPSTAVKMVHIHVSQLRKVLPDGMLRTRPPGYILDAPPDAIDLVRFTRLRSDGRAALAAGDLARARDLLAQALSLWGGEPLAEFSEPFAGAERAHLEELHLTCEEDRIEADLALGRHADLAGELDALVARYPLRERLVGQLMLARYRAGRHVDALAAYQELRRRLDDELGLVPSAHLGELEQRILLHDPALQPAREAPAPAVAPAEPPDVRPPPAPIERRRLTVVVCELSGTAEADGLDLEDFQGLVTRYHAACQEALEPFAGHVTQYHGEEVVAYFGYPAAREDAPRDGVRAALAIAARLDRLHIQSHVAVHTGYVLTGEIAGRDGQRLAVGQTVTLASRIAASSEPGTVTLSEDTERLVRGYIDTRPLGRRRFDVTPHPVALFAATGETGVRTRLELAEAQGLTPMVGRDDELELLRARCRRAAAGAGQVVLIHGEPGIGKSRLTAELIRGSDERRHTQIVLRCSAQHTSSVLHPVAEAFGEQLSLEPLDDESPHQHKQRLLSDISSWILGHAAERSLLLLVEDLQWADATTLELLDLLVRQVPSERVLVVATVRPDLHPSWTALSYVTHLTLDRLQTEEVEGMVSGLLNGAMPPAELVARVEERTDGVPLFIEELVKTLMERSVLRRGEEGVELADTAGADAIPETLHDSLMARLDGVGAAAKDLTQLASILGRDFRYEMLAAVSELDPEQLDATLARLVDAELLYQRGAPPQATYLFKHALIHEAAYDSIVRSVRERHHQKVANVLVRQFPHRAESEPELLAWHLTAAGRALPALEQWHRASERALRASAYVEAIAQLEQALGLLDAFPPGPGRSAAELQVQLRLGTACMASRGYSSHATEAAFARAEALCQELEDSRHLGPALYGLAVFYCGRSDYPRAQALSERMHRIAVSAGDADLLLEANTMLGVTHVLAGDFPSGQSHLEDALQHWDPERYRAHAFDYGQDPGVMSLVILGLSLVRQGAADEGERVLARGLEAARASAHPLSICVALGMEGVAAMELGDAPRVDRAGDELLRLGEQHGLPQWLTWGRLFRGWAAMKDGDFDAGLDDARTALVAAHGMGFDTMRPYFLSSLAALCSAAGRDDDARMLLVDPVEEAPLRS